MSVPWARVRAMRLLHTSDWHLGRSLHRADLRAAQSAFLDHLVDVARAEKVDAVLVAGDVYDRAVPPVDAVELCEDALLRLHDAGARIVLISGNHDSARRLGFGSGLLERRACTCAPGPPHWPGQSSSRTPRAAGRVRGAVPGAGRGRGSCPRARTRSPAGTPGCSGTRPAASAPTPRPAGYGAVWSWRTAGSAAERPANPSATSASAGWARCPPSCSPASATSPSATCTASRPSPRRCVTAARRCRTRSPRPRTARAAGWSTWTTPGRRGSSRCPRRSAGG
jgi:hypothetical protein